MIFRTIKDEITGANKSIGLFGLSLKDLRAKGIKNVLFNEPTIDVKAIEKFNEKILDGASAQNAFEEASEGANQATINLMKSAKGSIVTTTQLEAAQKASTLAARAQSAAFKAASVAINALATMAIVQIVTTIANTIITKIGEVVNSYQNGIAKIKDLSSEIKSLESEQASLNSELKESKERLHELQQLEMPTLFEKDEIENLKEYNKQLELQIRLKNLELEQKNQDANNEAQKDYDTFINTPIENGKSRKNIVDEVLDTYKRYQDAYQRTLKNGDKWASENNKRSLENLKEYYKDSFLDYADELNIMLTGLDPTKDGNDKIIQDIESILQEINELYDLSTAPKDFTEVYEDAKFYDITSQLNNLAKAGELNEDTFWNVEGIEDFVTALESVNETNIESVISSIINKVQESGESAQPTADNFENLADKIAQIKKNSSDAISDIQAFTDAIEKINNGESLDYDSIMSLIEIDPSIAQNIIKVADGYTIAVDDLIAADNKYKANNKDSIEDEIKSVTEKIAEREALLPKLQQHKEQWEKELELHISDDRDTELQLRIEGIDKQIAELDELKSELATLNLTLNEFNDASTIEAVSLEELSSGYDLLNSVTEEFNKNGNITASTLESITNTYPRMKSVVDQYLQGLIDENELIEQLSNAYKTDEDNYYKYLLLKLGYEEDYINEAFEGNDSIVDYFAENYKTDLTNFKDYIRQKQAIQESFDKLVGKGVSEFWTEEGGYTDAFLDLKGDSKVIIDGIIHEYQEAMDNLDLDFQTKGEKFEKDLEGIKNRTSSALNAEGDSKSSGSSDKFSKTFNWVEIAIEKVSKAASKLGNIVSNTFKSWTDRNSALKKQIKEVNKEIELQQKAYELYTQKANSVGLSDYWTNKIRNGSIDISVITDEDLADKIDEFKEWYLKMPLYPVTGGGILFNC